jgi:hypothetical protein
MTTLCRELERLRNFDQLREEVLKLIQEHPGQQQIICQGLDPYEEDWLTGTGRIADWPVQREQSYCWLNSSLKGTELAEIIQRYSAYRTRIMRQQPRQCYSIHRDQGQRIHIPIKTTDQSWMIWPQRQTCVQLTQGGVYLTDTRELHTAVNGDLSERIHLVLAVD